jgi:hypothetical protein
MKESSSSRANSPPSGAGGGERRRIARYIPGDGGNVSLQWHVAPADYERPVLELLEEGSATMTLAPGGSPYDRPMASLRRPKGATRINPRELSESIRIEK